jgi:hypothetical protein
MGIMGTDIADSRGIFDTTAAAAAEILRGGERQMITVEFRERDPNSDGRRVVATLTVADDHTYVVAGDLPLEEISILDRAAPGGRLTLAADPVRWARKSHKAFRAGYIVPVITEDTLPADGES